MGKGRFIKMKEKRKKIASERIQILLGLAKEESEKGRLDRASRYAHLARKIGKRYNVRMPSSFKINYCKKCGTYRIPSKTSRTRISKGRIVIQCLNCGGFYRRPFIDQGE